jgi:hypothetical protein
MMNQNVNKTTLPVVPVEIAPVTKVFVGNISERAPDPMIRQMLQVINFLFLQFE